MDNLTKICYLCGLIVQIGKYYKICGETAVSHVCCGPCQIIEMDRMMKEIEKYPAIEVDKCYGCGTTKGIALDGTGGYICTPCDRACDNPQY